MRTVRIVRLALLAALTAASAPGQAAEIGGKARAILDEHVSGIVTLRVVIKVEFLGQSREKRLQARGILVSEGGLVMTASSVVSPNVNVRANGREVEDVRTSAEEIEVVFGNEDEEQDAFLVGKDSKLGFAFVQVQDFDPDARELWVPDFTKAKQPAVGEPVVTLNRLVRGFDYAPYFEIARVVGEVRKPRKAHLLSNGGGVGLPAFDLEGELVGAHARLRPGVGGGKSKPVLLGGAIVAGAIGAARGRARGMLEERSGDGDDDAQSAGRR